MSLPIWLQELKDAAATDEIDEYSRALWAEGARLIRIAEAAEGIAKDHPSPAMRAALRGDDK